MGSNPEPIQSSRRVRWHGSAAALIGAFALVAACAPSTQPANAQPAADAGQPGAAPETDMYGQNNNLKILVWRADTSGAPGPAVIFFHGGGYSAGDASQFSQMCAELAQQAITCASADYTLSSGDQQVSEAKQAVTWLRDHGAQLHINADRVFVGGGSAGGYLALSTALINPQRTSMPAGLILLNPGFAAQPPGPTENLQDDLRNRLPPTIWFHGTADTTVPYAGAQAFVGAARSAGSPVDLESYPGRKHGFFNYAVGDRNPDFDTVTKRVVQFIKSTN
jgi:acetyl esterase/lipase